jgi:predicted nucleic acid-binding protein
MFVVLDTGPLGMVTHPRASDENRECGEWLLRLLAKGETIVVPEIADYELRRELLRADKAQSVKRLDALLSSLFYLPLTTPVMKHAAHLWAQARNEGRPTAPMEALDADVILAAQALSLTNEGQTALVATTNVGHLGRFVDARAWREIL